MSIKKEKEIFEDWYEKHRNGRQISCDYVYEDNSYSIGYANAMWISWQASAQRQGYKFVPVENIKSIYESCNNTLDINNIDIYKGLAMAIIDDCEAMIGE